MKKRLNQLLCVSLCLSLLAGTAVGCGSSTDSSSDTTGSTESASDSSGTVTTASSDDYILYDIPGYDEEETAKYMDGVEETNSDAVGMEELPDSYIPDDMTNNATEQGTLVELDYKRELTTASGDPLYSTAVVYLPYGYTEEKQYDVLYLMHGMGGSQYTFLGNESLAGGMKVVLDSMIENGDIKPVIVVAPGLEESADVDLANQVIGELINTIVKDLIPLVESTYSTYAESTSEEDLIASRDHRCFGGFSMGGCATWHMLWYYPQYFRYYIPNSMIADFRLDADVSGTTEEMATNIREEGYTSDDFQIYCGVGTEDYTNFMVEKQINACLEYEDLFTDTGDYGFEKGNLMYRVWPDRVHRFYESFPYFYNALKLFFPAE